MRLSLVRVVLLATLVLAAVLPAGCSSSVYDSKEMGISFKIPAGWRITRESSQGTGLVQLETDNGATIYVGRVLRYGIGYALKDSNTDLQEAFQEIKNHLQTQKASNLKTSTTTFDGLPAYRLEYDSRKGSKRQHSVETIAAKDHKVYSVIVTADENRFRQALAGFQKVVDSFKIQ